VQREAALRRSLLDGGVLLEHSNGLVDVELCDADGAGVVVRQLL
jgi:hypothetical protein